MKSSYDFYEYRVPTMEDYCCEREALEMAIKNNYSCYLRTKFLPDGSKFCFTSSYVGGGRVFHDLYSGKFVTHESIKHLARWNRNKKSIPVIRRVK